MHYLVKHRNAKIAPVKCCVKGFPEINQKLLVLNRPFADLKVLIFSSLYDSINLGV